MLEINSLVDGKYRILKQVGKGGMSVVYLAMNERANKQWAIKEVRKDGGGDNRAGKQNLIAETDMLKRLHHAYLPSIVDVIDKDDSFLIVMDYVEGNSLNKALKEYGPQPQEYVIEWGKQLCDVLGYLHSREPAIIYRDMKPGNIMLKPDGNICLIDFGTAREYKEGSIEDTQCLGTRGYAAPEQYGGQGQTDARTDIFCLGATLFHLVTGVNPAAPPYEMKPITQIDPTLSTGLEQILLKCTQNDPDKRYQSCAELMYDLEHYDEMDVSARKKQKRKLFGFLAVAAMAVLFLAAAAGFRTGERKLTKASYDNYISSAEKQITDPELAYETYMEAIAANPKRYEAYQGILNLYISDGELSKEEAQKLTEALTRYDGGRETNDTYFESNYRGKKNNEYAGFCYNFGVAYLSMYGGDGDTEGYRQAGVYLSKAAGNTWNDSFGEALAEDLSDYATTTYNALHANANALGSGTVDYDVYYATAMRLCSQDWGDSGTFAVNLAVRIMNNVSGSMLSKFVNAKLTQEQMEALVESAYSLGMNYAASTEDETASRVRLGAAYEDAMRKIESQYASRQ